MTRLPSTLDEALAYFASLTASDLRLALLGLATLAGGFAAVLLVAWVVRAAGRKR